MNACPLTRVPYLHLYCTRARRAFHLLLLLHRTMFTWVQHTPMVAATALSDILVTALDTQTVEILSRGWNFQKFNKMIQAASQD